MSILQSAGGLFGYLLGCPFAWGPSNVFSIAIFVVVILFSLLLITGIPASRRYAGEWRKIGGQIRWKP